MHISTLIILALSAGALSLPTNTTEPVDSEGALEKRGTFGWIAAFGNGDDDCSGLHYDHRPKMNKQGCIKFHNDGPFVGVNWGTNVDSFEGIQGYTDDNCKHFAGARVMKENVHNGGGRVGANSCIAIDGKYQKTWKSVKALGVPLS